MEALNKKYGLFTAICMVVGIVIGSGIFFKAKDVLVAAGGSSFYSIAAWIISGIIMAIIATTFAVMATKYEKINGAVDYAEAMCGRTYAYYVGWFMSLIYYPAMTAVLAWVSARYTLVLCGYIEAPLFALDGATNSSLNSPECITIALLYLILAYFINTIAPKIAGKFQVSSTLVKLVPIAFIAIVGTVIGVVNGNLASNFDPSSAPEMSGNTGLFPAICSTIFAYEGWSVATSINSEMKDSKKNLPIALCVGSLIIVAAYTLYNVGILGLANAETVTSGGTTVAFNTFGPVVSTVINAFVVVSCMGTLNGLMMGCSRGIYSLSARDEGFAPDVYAQVDKKTGMPHNAAVLSLFACALWFVYFIFAGGGFFPWDKVNEYGFDSSELPIITLYAMYIPVLVAMMVKEKELHPVKRFVLPITSILGIGLILYATGVKHGMDIVWYLIVFGMIMLGGLAVSIYNKKKSNS